MTYQRPELTPRQKILRGVVFGSATVFVLLHLLAGGNPTGVLNIASWIAAIIAVGGMVAFLWDVKKSRR
jgi:hypothetical protein